MNFPLLFIRISGWRAFTIIHTYLSIDVMCVNIYLALIPLYINLHDDNISINNLQYILKSDRLHWGLNVHEGLNALALLSTYQGCINILFPKLLQSQHDSAAWVESCLSRRYQGVVGHVNITEIKEGVHSEAMFYFEPSPNCIVDQLSVLPVAIEV